MDACTVQRLLSMVLQEPLFQLGTKASEEAKILVRSILSQISTRRENREKFEEFSKTLVGSLEQACVVPATVKCHSTKRERFWASFHSKQVHELPDIWSSLIRNVGCEEAGPGGMVLLSQHINQKLFEEILRARTSLINDTEASQRPLTVGEANALRYAAGYVPFALKKKLSHRPEFVQCLDQLGVSGQGDTYLEYTKKWIELVNRGKLFTVSDETYRFFHDLEMKVCAYLKDIFLAGGQADQSKEEIVSSIVEDTDVQFSWLLLCLDLDDEYLSNELLKSVVEMWLTIRGFSMANIWMEYYKQSDESNIKSKKGLRKGLKRKKITTRRGLNNCSIIVHKKKFSSLM